MECQCKECRNACEYKPGWFLPDQIDFLLNYFNVFTIIELFDTGKFAIDYWWEENEENILILAPNILNNDKIYYPGDPRGVCVFYKNEKCEIHKIKPFECMYYDHAKKDNKHEYVAKKWKEVDVLEKFRDLIKIEEFNILNFYLGVN